MHSNDQILGSVFNAGVDEGGITVRKRVLSDSQSDLTQFPPQVSGWYSTHDILASPGRGLSHLRVAQVREIRVIKLDEATTSIVQRLDLGAIGP